MSLPDFASRQTALQRQLQPHQAYVIARATHISYLTGFAMLVPEEREAFAVLTPHSTYLLHASFSPTPATQKKLLKKEGVSPLKLAEHIKDITTHEKISELLLDTQALYVNEWHSLQTLPDLRLTSADLTPLDTLRGSKDPAEIELITQASMIATQAFTQLQQFIKPGVTELALAQQLEQLMRQRGAQGPAFPTIVAYGAHSALPHHQPTSTPLQPETAVLIDFGAMLQAYRSDITRTFWFGSQPAPEFLKIESIVKDAYQAALNVLRHHHQEWPTAQAIDAATRTLITDAGYGKNYIHTTGHGVGLDIHESPSLNWSNVTPLQDNSVITVEPGIYLPGKFGYRYENTLALTPQGVQELTV